VNDFIGSQGVGMVWPGPDRTRTNGYTEEFGIKLHGNDVVIALYENHASAMRILDHHRADLRKLNIPEEFWPILVSRTVETVVGSWRHHGE
jgi:hypothetical protein